MDVFAYLIGGFGVGFGFGAVFSYLFLKGKLSSVEVIKKEKEFAEQENSRLKEESKKLNDEVSEIKAKNEDLARYNNEILSKKQGVEIELSKLQGELKNLKENQQKQEEFFKEQNSKQEKWIKEQQEQQKSIFQNLSNTALEKQNESGKQKMDEILKPLKEVIENNSKNYTKTSGEISGRIEEIMKRASEIGDKADRLASAFEGDKKGQGNFGELKFEQLLNWYTLTEGENYYKQYLVKTEEQRKKYPDFIVQAQPNKWLVVDSKFSFMAYEKYVKEKDEVLKQKYLEEYVSNLKNRIKELGEKEYHKLLKQNGKETFDFVCLFFGNEMAYLTAISNIQYRQEIESLSRQYKVVVLTASAFSPILQMIQQLWSIGKTNENIIKAREIIEKWLTKIADFNENMESVGKAIGKAQKDYDDAIKKLRGTGNANNLANEVIKLVDAKLKPKDGKERIIRDNLFLSNENNNAEE